MIGGGGGVDQRRRRRSEAALELLQVAEWYGLLAAQKPVLVAAIDLEASGRARRMQVWIVLVWGTLPDVSSKKKWLRESQEA
jgi:hypothetical protein